MAVENDFLVFAGGAGANVLPQASYVALAALATGFQSGVAQSVQLNKVWRQSSIIAAMIGQFIADESGQPAIDDGTTATLETNFKTSIRNSTALTLSSLSGASNTATAAMNGNLIRCSNSGQNMNLVLPGSSPGFLPVGWTACIVNSSTSGGILSITAGSGAKINRVTGSILYLGNQQAATIYSDGVGNYWVLSAPGLTQLGANADFYVSPTGNDTTNDGLTASTAWQSLQHAWNTIQSNFNLNSNTVTVHMADGTYTGGITANGPLTGQSGGGLQFVGDVTTPDNVFINVTNGLGFGAFGGATFSVQACKVAASGTGVNQGQGVVVGLASSIGISNVDFGSCSVCHIGAGTGGTVIVGGSYKVSGPSQYHWESTSAGTIQINSGITISVVGSATWSGAFAVVQDCGIIRCGGVTFGGTGFTGNRYSAVGNGVIDTGGGGPSYLPGTVAGTTGSGGQYI